jgi:hypothetical protein
MSLTKLIPAGEGKIANLFLQCVEFSYKPLLSRDYPEICSSLTPPFSAMQAKSEEQMRDEKAWQDAERVWLVHREGFTAAKQVSTITL